MSDELKAKLGEIIENIPTGDSMSAAIPTDNDLAKIHQAYKDEGYMKVPKQVEETWQAYNHMAGFMSGQEWYERFKREFNSNFHVFKQDADEPERWFRASDIREAAKRAAGIK